MTKFFVIEARRLLPLMFLLVLLVSLSVYDNFFRVQPVDTRPVIKEDFTFLTTTRGEVTSPSYFVIAHTEEEWAQLQENPLVNLPDYPYNPSYEVALCTVNYEVDKVDISTSKEGLTKVEIQVTQKPNYYHVVTVNRDKIETSEVSYTFIDSTGEVLLQETIKQ